MLETDLNIKNTKMSKYLLIVLIGVACLYYDSVIGAIYSSRIVNLDLNYDSMLRLEIVREFLRTGAWFDNTVDRILPPVGLESHWSRYVDLILALLILFFSVFFDQSDAERIASVVWPATAYLILFVSVVGATRRLWGNTVACFAIIALILSPFHTRSAFALGNFDHHAILLGLSGACFALLANRDRSTFWPGLICAFMMVISLEAIFLVVFLAGFVATKWVYGGCSKDSAGPFFIALGFGMIILFGLETPPSKWFILQCDAVSLPYLVLAAGVAALGIVCLAAQHHLHSRASRVLIVVAGACICGAFAYKFYAPCANGTYDSISATTYKLVLARHVQVIGMFDLVVESPVTGLRVVGSLLVSGIFTIWLFAVSAEKGKQDTDQFWAIVLIMFFLAGTLAGAAFQMRAFAYGYAVFPIVFGLFAVSFWNKINTKRKILAILSFVLIAPAFINPVFYHYFARSFFEYRIASPYTRPFKFIEPYSARECMSSGQVVHLTELPPGNILAQADIGSRILIHSHHTVATIMSHRLPQAMDNAVLPFLADETELKRAVEQNLVDYVVVCSGLETGIPGSIGNQLGRGTGLPWLHPVKTSASLLRVFKVTLSDA